jgi:hypothetical protein
MLCSRPKALRSLTVLDAVLDVQASLKESPRGEHNRLVLRRNDNAHAAHTLRRGTVASIGELIMAKSSEITLAFVQTRLDKIRTAAAKPPEDPIYQYLHSLYRLHRQFGEPKEGEIRKFFDREYEKLNHKKIQHTFFRVMVHLTMPPGTAPQYRSRYANALQYAFRKIPPSAGTVLSQRLPESASGSCQQQTDSLSRTRLTRFNMRSIHLSNRAIRKPTRDPATCGSYWSFEFACGCCCCWTTSRGQPNPLLSVGAAVVVAAEASGDCESQAPSGGRRDSRRQLERFASWHDRSSGKEEFESASRVPAF